MTRWSKIVYCMATKQLATGITPSKDALRILRRLAYSNTPTTSLSATSRCMRFHRQDISRWYSTSSTAQHSPQCHADRRTITTRTWPGRAASFLNELPERRCGNVSIENRHRRRSQSSIAVATFDTLPLNELSFKQGLQNEDSSGKHRGEKRRLNRNTSGHKQSRPGRYRLRRVKSAGDRPSTGTPFKRVHLRFTKQAALARIIKLKTAEVPYLAADGSIPAFKKHPYFRLRHRAADHSLAYDDRVAYIYNHMLIVRTQLGLKSALETLEKTLHVYAATGLTVDWHLAQNVYLNLCYHFPPEGLRSIQHALVASLLQESPPRLEAVGILFARMKREKRVPYNHASRYLQSFCRNCDNEALQLDEAEKILKAMRLHLITPHADVILPVIRGPVLAGRTDIAYARLQDLCVTYNMRPSYNVVSELITGFGRSAGWSQLDELFVWLHQQQIPREQPRAFAALFRHAFKLFSSYNYSCDQTYDFFSYCLHNCGLVPTRQLTIEVITLLIPHRRYDLIQKCTKDRQHAFPGLLNPMSSALSAYVVSTAWSSSNSTCLDILAGCQALAYGAVRDPFSDEFRYVAMEALMEDISSCCQRLLVSSGRSKKDLLDNCKDYQKLHDYAYDLAVGTKTSSTLTRQYLLVQEVLRRLSAAQTTVLLLKNFNTYCQTNDNWGSHNGHQALPKGVDDETNNERSQIRIAQHLRVQLLSTVDDMKNTIDADREQGNGRRRNRFFYFNLVKALMIVGRERDVVTLLQAHYASDWFGQADTPEHPLYSVWLRCAIELKEPQAVSEVLWAIVNAPSHVELPARLLVLVRIAQKKILFRTDNRIVRQNQNQLKEIEHLKRRIYRRKWWSMGCPTAEGIEEPNLRDWRQTF